VPGGARSRRTTPPVSGLRRAAPAPDVVFAGASGGGYVFPDFLPAYDAVMSMAKLLELLGRSRRSLAELVADLPAATRIRRSAPCPWSLKGIAMRRMIEAVKGMEVDHLDGIKVFEDDGWAQVIPDPDEPLFHIYAEGRTPEDSERLEARYRELLQSVVGGRPAAVL